MSSSQVKAQRLANEANVSIANKSNDTSIELMREQNQWNLDQWERENLYNSPEQQRQRLEAAGLNPLLLEGWSSGNASGPAQAANLPQIATAQVQPEYADPQIKANAFQQIAGAFKNFGEFSKSMSESGMNVQQFSFVRDMALKGYNPEIIKARSALEMYNQLITQGKYQVPQIEAIIRDYDQRANFNAWAAEVRRQEVDKIRAEYEGIKFTNKFNADKAPLELAKIYAEVRDIFLGTDIKKSVAESQINLADQQAALAQSQAGLASAQTEKVDEETQGVRYDNAVKHFKARLADIGINPDDKHLPFFLGVGMNVLDNKVPAWKVSQLFDAVGDAEMRSWKSLSEGHADLSKFNLYGDPSGPFSVIPGASMVGKDMKDWFFHLFSDK